MDSVVIVDLTKTYDMRRLQPTGWALPHRPSGCWTTGREDHGEENRFPLQYVYLSHRRGVSAMCLLHKILHGAAPPPMLDLCPPRAPPRRSTKQTHLLLSCAPPHTKRTETQFYARSFLPLLSSFFNSSIPPNLQAETRLQPFKEAINASVDMTSL